MCYLATYVRIGCLKNILNLSEYYSKTVIRAKIYIGQKRIQLLEYNEGKIRLFQGRSSQ